MKQNIHAIATALGFWKLKAKGLRLKAVDKFRSVQLTNRLLLRPNAEPNPSLITMTGKGGKVRFNRSIPNSNAPSLPNNSALAVAVAIKKFLHYHYSNWRSGEFLVTFFGKKGLAFPPAMRRGNSQSEENNLNTEAFTTPFNSPASGVHWVHIYRVGMGTMILKWFSRQLKQVLLTRRPFDFSFDPAQDDSSQGDLSVRKEVRIKKLYRYKKHHRLRPNLLMLLLTLVVIIGTGNKTKAQTKALQIGDTIPEALWNLPLKAVQHPKGKNTFTLNDYKDKLIILAFWETSCASCICLLRKLRNLQEEFPADLAVIPITCQNFKIAEHFLKNKDNWLLSVVKESRLSEWFPCRCFPQQVWIKDGKLVLFPKTEYANRVNIEKLLLEEE